MTRYTEWSITQDRGKYWVRRWKVTPEGRSLERLDLKKYEHLRHDYEKLRDFVIRLNNRNPDELAIRARLDIEHAFISPSLLLEYFNVIAQRLPNRKNARRNFGYLQNHVLGYFVKERKLKDPLAWQQEEHRWAAHLEKQSLAASTLNTIVYEANAFLDWLHKQRPTEVIPIKLNPFTRAKRKFIEAERRRKGEVNESQYIPIEKVATIWWDIDNEFLQACMCIACCYGLREAEVLGLKLEDIREDFLSVERQLVALPSPNEPEYSSLKGREVRTLKHHAATAEECYEWLAIVLSKLCHPNTLSQRWSERMREMGLDYRFHDTRHFFITNSLRTRAPRDVQLEAGHKNIMTTMGYAHDDRALDGARPFIPKKAK